jgi:hypothetical protein
MTGERAAEKAIPKITAEGLRRALFSAFAETKSELTDIFSHYGHNCISIDGVSIGNSKFLNVDVVNAASIVCPFTYDFFTAEGAFATDGFVEALYNCLESLDNGCGIKVAGVVSDGARFQIKALNWKDSASIQQVHGGKYRRLLFIPCVCHRLQNSLKELYESNEYFRECISHIRYVAVKLRKPDARAALGRTCPSHCATRWIYDYPILDFIYSHMEEIEESSIGDRVGLRRYSMAYCSEMLPFLQKLFVTVRILEADNAALGRVFPVVDELLTLLHHSALAITENRDEGYEDEEMDDRLGKKYRYRMSPGLREVIYAFDDIVRARVLNSTRCLYQLAYVMTPEGRERARAERVNPPEARIPFASTKERNDLAWSKFSEVNDMPRLEDLIAKGLVDDEPEGEMSIVEEHEGIASEELVESRDVTRYMNLGRVNGLAAEAEKGLREILKQFEIVDAEIELVIGTFQRYIEMAPVDLPLKPGPVGPNENKKSVYSWSAAPDTDGWPILADIGMRLAALVCSEAISERTNSQMRRLLAPYRMNMGKDMLLARMLLAKHGEAKKR